MGADDLLSTRLPSQATVRTRSPRGFPDTDIIAVKKRIRQHQIAEPTSVRRTLCDLPPAARNPTVDGAPNSKRLH
jgi:hypothetical protein